MVDHARDFVRNSFSVLAAHVLIYLQGLLLTPILIKTAGVTLYGGYVLLITMLGFLFGISSFGVGFRCRRFLPDTEDVQKRRALFFPQFTFQLISASLLAVLAVIFYPYAEAHFFKGDVPFLPWLVLPYLLFLTIYSQGTDYFRYTHRLNIFNYATLAQPYLFIGLALLGYEVMQRFTVNALLIANIAALLMVGAWLLVRFVREIGFALRLASPRELINDIRIGFPLMLNYVVDVILSVSDRYVIAAFLSVTSVGYYSPAYALGSMVIFFAKVTGVVLPPLMSRLVDREQEASASSMVDYAMKGYLLLAIPFIAGCAILAKPILTVYTNAELAGHAYLVMPIVALGALFYGMNIILSNVLFVRMETGVMFRVNALAAVLNLSMNLILLFYIRNITVAAATTALSYFVAFAYTIFKVRSTWNIGRQLPVILKSVSATGIMVAALVWYLRDIPAAIQHIGVIAVAVALGFGVYVTGLILLRTFSRHEWQMLRKAMAT